MRRQDVLIGAALGTTAGLVTSPVIQIAVRATLTDARPLPVFGGAALATAFFMVSAVTAAIFQNSQNLKAAMLIVYGTKSGLVLLALQSLNLDNSDAKAFVISMILSAVLYLIFQTLYIAKWRRKYRNFRA